MGERKLYYWKRDYARKNPDKMLCINIDSMEQWKASIPGYFSKEESEKFKIRLTGIIAHGMKDPYFVYVNLNHTGETNMNIYCLIDVLEQVFFSFFIYLLVWMGQTEECEVVRPDGQYGQGQQEQYYVGVSRFPCRTWPLPRS